MSTHYRPVAWNRRKLVYDAAILAFVAAWVGGYFGLGWLLHDPRSAFDALGLAIKATGTAALLMLACVLAIGPLARLSPRLLGLLYNRRHLGVATCLVALAHALGVFAWHIGHDQRSVLAWLAAFDPTLGQDRGLPFVPLGMAALLLMLLLTATSHDFWLAFLSPPAWKALHMAAYGAFALAFAHYAFGAAQAAHDPAVPLGFALLAVCLVALHLAAARAGRAPDIAAPPHPDPPWIIAARHAEIAEGRAVIVRPPGGERVAIFRHGNRLSAVTNLCTHQNGPLGEGRIIDGLITCPWHGFQFRPEDGCAPAPFSDRIATFRLRLDGPHVLLDPRPNPPGTPVAPLALPPA